MFSVGVSDHMMIAHSLRGETFGPAQRLHGATYEVRVELRAAELDADGIVMDIGALRNALRDALAPLEYHNLDELPEFTGSNSTTEVICQHVHAALSRRLAVPQATELQVTLTESPVAWASYTAPLYPRE
jgi:6-pyruvoyltetrahydropterin/6-carboxytetrahydropterin synthase